jgi:hypothetical protein
MTKRRKDNYKRRVRRKRAEKAIKHRATIKRYRRELERSQVPPSSVKAATTMMMILVGATAKTT